MKNQAGVAVVITTVLRPSLVRAVRSVFRQDLGQPIQILIGIDKRLNDDGCLSVLTQECPPHINITIIDLGYSTSSKSGGLYSNNCGGALRTILSYAANGKYIAYLDDDDWWSRDHLSGLLSAIAGKEWAFSYRWLVDHETAWPICRDEWDALGPGRGINLERFGGFVNPSNLMIDKQACHFVLPYWSFSAFEDGTGDDRVVFDILLKNYAWAASRKYSCYYDVPRDVQKHDHHAREFAARNITWIEDRAQIDTIVELLDEAKRALDAGSTEEAILACRRAIALNRYHAPSLHCLALSERQAGNREKYLACNAEASEMADGFPAEFPLPELTHPAMPDKERPR